MLASLHSRIALSAIFFAFAIGAWSAWNFFRGRELGSNYWGALVIGEILILVQDLIGVLMLLIGARPEDWLHLLYGVLVALTWPGVYIYTGARKSNREAGVYAIVSFFMFGLLIRAVMTGGPLR